MSTEVSTLAAEKREHSGKGVARKLRAAGRVPAVLYGRDLEALHLSVNAHDAELLFRSISVDNTIVELAVDGEKAPFQTLVREIQMHPYKAHLIHIDFLRIQKGVLIDVDIPIHVTGTPKGVRLSGGIVELIVHELSVSCIPSKIPESIDIDITELDIGDSIHVSDLVGDKDFEINADPGLTIVAVSLPRGIEEAEEGEDDGEEAGEVEDGAEDVEG